MTVTHATNTITAACGDAGLAGPVATFQAGDPVTHAVDRGPATGWTMATWSRMTAEAAHRWLGWARHDARPGSRGHGAGAAGKKQRRGRGGRG